MRDLIKQTSGCVLKIQYQFTVISSLFLPLFLFAMAASSAAWAGTFAVNSTADAVDANIGNDICATSSGACTLRAAIQEANAQEGQTDIINVPAGTYTFTRTGINEENAATGDLDITDPVIINGAGAGSTIINGAGLDRIVDVMSGISFSMNGLTIRNGDVNGRGAGIQYVTSLTLTDVVLTSNSASGEGGGIYCEAGVCSLTLINSAVSSNTASKAAGIWIKSGSGTVSITDSTIAGNIASGISGGLYVENFSGGISLNRVTINGNSGDNGGGIFFKSNNTADLLNVTVSGNQAIAEGGGILNVATTLTLTNVTFLENAGGPAKGGGLNQKSGSATVKNTIIANSPSGGDCFGTIISSGNNLDSDSTCGFALTAEPLLLPLHNNGGPTLTHAPSPTSPAIDAGSNTGAPATDQRGYPRPVDGNGDLTATADIGAYEAGPLGSTISGTIFEDANFNGTAADYEGTVNDQPLANVDVELYNSSDVYLDSTTTDTNGSYSFAGVLDGTYKVRVRSATIADADTPPKGGLNATVPVTWPYPLPEMTWGNGTVMYGGQDVTVDDTTVADNSGPGDTYASITVSGAGVSDVNFGFAYNLIVNTGDDSNADNVRSKQGSLRQFIKNANAIGQAVGTTANSSHFRISNGLLDVNGVASIVPVSELPIISDTTGGMIIDGTTQTSLIGDTNANGPEVELDGTNAGASANGLNITTGNCTVRGLVINRFTQSGIVISGGTGTTVAGNYIGTNFDGTVQAGNSQQGILLSNSTDNTIGGTSDAERNVISGNRLRGVLIYETAASGNQVLGNYIGTNATGTATVSNQQVGIYIWNAPGNTIGGTVSDAGNVISGNTWNGVYVWGASASGNLLHGNTVGMNVTGTVAVPNGDGVAISSAPGNSIGGTAAGEANIIAGNTGRGVYIAGETADTNTISTNSIYNNGSLGIDLDPGGSTPNDSGDGDSGPNNLQNFPILTAANSGGASINVQGTLNSAANTTFRVEFFSNSAVDPSGYGEGETYLDSVNVTTDNSGNAAINVNFPIPVPAGSFISATATDPSNNTSEFGEPAQVITGTDLSVSKTVDDSAPNELSTITYTVTVTNNGPATATNVTLTDQLPVGVTYVSDTPNQGSYVGGTGVWTVGDLATGASAVLTITASVDSGTGGISITNTADNLSADQTDTDSGNNQDSVAITVQSSLPPGTPQLYINKASDADGFVTPGETITYTINVTNTGTVPLSGVSVTDALPAGTAYVVGSTRVTAPASILNETVRDEFNSVSFGNNDGSVAWATNWMEIDGDGAGPAAGNVQVSGGELSLDDRPNTGGSPSLAREVNLSGASSATLSFNFETDRGVDASDSVVVEVSPNGGGSWTTLENFTGINGATSGIRSYDIIGSIAANTRIRFRVNNSYGGTREQFFVDNVQIAYTVSGPPGTGPGRPPPTLASGYSLAVGEQMTVTFQVEVNDPFDDPDLSVENTASANSDQTGSKNSNELVDLVGGADLAINKTIDKAAPNEGETITYTVTVINNGPETATNIIITDQLPAGVTYVSDTPSQGSYDSTTGAWTAGALANGASATLTLTTTVDAGTSGSSISNSAAVSGLDQVDPVPGNNSDSADIFVGSIDLVVSKAVDKATPGEGETITYTVTMTNNGPNDATNIIVTDQLPAGVTYASDIPSQGSYDSSTGMWVAGDLSSGASATLAITATVDAGTAGTMITNTVSVTAVDQGDSNAANNTDMADLIIQGADLAVSKTVDDSTPNERSTITYTVSVTNNGPATATNVTLIDQLPAGITYVSSIQGQGAYNRNTGVWSVGYMATGASAELTITASVDPGTGGATITNTADNLSADQADPDSGNNHDSVAITVQPFPAPGIPQLDINKASDAGGFVNPGETITYTINVTNTGTVPLSGVSVTDALPAGTAYVVGSTQITAPASTVNETVRDEFNSVSFGNNDGSVAWATNWIEIDGKGAGPAAGNVKVSGGEISLDDHPNTGGSPSLAREVNLYGATSATLSFNFRTDKKVDASDSVVVEVSPNGGGSWTTLEDFTGIKGATSGTRSYDIIGSIAANTRIRFRVNNSYGGPAEHFFVGNVQIAYAVSGPPATGPGGPPPTLASGYSLAGGEQMTVTFQVEVNDPFDDPDLNVDNTASADSDQTGSKNSNGVVDLIGGADLAINKTIDKAVPDEGETIAYTVTVTNNGPETATNITVIDQLPAGVTYVSDTPGQGSYDSTIGVWTAGALANGASATLMLTTTVDAGTSGSTISNSAAVSGLDQVDPVPGNNSGSADILVGAIDLSLPLYLKGDGVPGATLSEISPTATTLPNYDPGRDSSPGLLLAKSSGLSETDSTKYQMWVSASNGISIIGSIDLIFWSAMKDFDTNKQGIVLAGLYECDPDGSNCTLIAQGQKNVTPWSGGSSTWVEYTIGFGDISRIIPEGRSLVVKIVVDSNSDDDMLFAYDTTSYPSRLDVAPPFPVPDILLIKSVQTFSDPYNGETNPKAIPRALMLYTVAVTNQGEGATDADTVFITDQIPADAALFVGDIDGPGSGPVQFVDGVTPSGLTYTFTSLNNMIDDVSFSNDGGTSYIYIPLPDGDGFDTGVTHLRVNPKGAFSGAGGANTPSFQVIFNVRVD